MNFRNILCGMTLAVMPLVSAATDPTEEIAAWFGEALAGNARTAATISRHLKAAEVAPMQESVWQAWREAVAASDAQPLPALRPLAARDTTIWAIPDSLEPDARMAFFYGSKGDARPEKGYPLFLYTHGSGEREREWATGLKLCSAFDDAPSVYMIPRIPNTGKYYRWWQQSKQWAWEKMLRHALASGEIDPDRVYIFGISEGGYGSQRLASFYADYLAAAGPMAGGEPLRNAPAENCRNIAFSLRTGDADQDFYRNLLTGYTKQAFDSLRAAEPGAWRNWIELIPGAGHHINYMPTPIWLSWNTRNPWPRKVSWEDFEMDGRHRRGFYNIGVVERPSGAERTRYDLSIDNDNNILLTARLVDYTTTEIDPIWDIDLKFDRSYRPATDGVVRLWLNSELIDFSRPVTVTVNGRRVFKGKVKPTLGDMVESCALFGDPRRVFPASVTVDLSKR